MRVHSSMCLQGTASCPDRSIPGVHTARSSLIHMENFRNLKCSPNPLRSAVFQLA